MLLLGNKVAATNDLATTFCRCYILDLAAGTLKLRHESLGELAFLTFTGLSAGTYTIRVVAKTSNRTVNVYNGGVLLVSGTIPNVAANLPQGSCIGIADSFQNGNIAIDTSRCWRLEFPAAACGFSRRPLWSLSNLLPGRS